MCMLLAQHTSIIAGASRPGGIGRCIVQTFAEQGASVAFGDRDAIRGKRFEKELLDAGHEAFFYALDLTHEDECHQFVDETIKRFGPINNVVASAGGSRGTGGPTLHQTSSQEMRFGWECNVILTHNLIKAAEPSLCQPSPHGAHRCIVLVGSINGRVGWTRELAYSASKEGLVGYCRCIAADLAPRGVCVNLVQPGSVPNLESPTWRARFEEPGLEDYLNSLYPLGRMGRPDDVAGAVLFLASGLAGWVTAVTLPVDGGITGIGPALGPLGRASGEWYRPEEGIVKKAA